MVQNLCIRRQGLCSWMTLPAYPRVVQPCQGVTHINIILNNNTRMQIRSQPCQCPVCSVHPIFGSLHMGALLGRPWLRCSLCHWLLRRWRRGYYWRRLKQWQRSEKINQFKKPLANYQIPFSLEHLWLYLVRACPSELERKREAEARILQPGRRVD